MVKVRKGGEGWKGRMKAGRQEGRGEGKDKDREGGREGGGRRYLVLLVLGDEVIHVALRLRELHLVHSLARVPRGGGRKEGRKGRTDEETTRLLSGRGYTAWPLANANVSSLPPFFPPSLPPHQ
jgi:hypothetical protein